MFVPMPYFQLVRHAVTLFVFMRQIRGFLDILSQKSLSWKQGEARSLETKTREQTRHQSNVFLFNYHQNHRRHVGWHARV